MNVAWLGLGMTFLAVVLVPLVTLIVRLAIRSTQVQDKLTVITEKLEKLVQDKDRVHLAIQQEIRDDRAATNLRLRWLEEHLWRKEGNSG